MNTLVSLWNFLLDFSGSENLPVLIFGLFGFVFLINYLFRPDAGLAEKVANNQVMRWISAPAIFYARNLALRRLTVNLLGVLLIVWFVQAFTAWVQPALKPGDLFPPPFSGAQGVELEIVEQGPVVKYATYTGTAQPIEFVEVNARVDGYIDELVVLEGDSVKAGDLLARLDTTDLRPQLENALADVSYWAAEWKRAQSLFQDSVISVSERDRIRKSYDSAQASVTHMRNRIDYASLRSPISGIVSSERAYKGQYIRKGERIFRVDRLDFLRLRFNVAERDLPFIQPGNSMWLEFPQIPMLAFANQGWKNIVQPTTDAFVFAALNGQLQNHATAQANPNSSPGMPAKVAVSFPAVDPKTHMGTVESRIANPGGLLKSDSYIVGRFMIERVSDVVRVPSRAIVEIPGGKSVVFVGPALSDEGEAEMRETETGLRTDSFTQILSGVEVGEFVIVRGQRDLTDGQLVTVVARKGGF